MRRPNSGAKSAGKPTVGVPTPPTPAAASSTCRNRAAPTRFASILPSNCLIVPRSPAIRLNRLARSMRIAPRASVLTTRPMFSMPRSTFWTSTPWAMSLMYLGTTSWKSLEKICLYSFLPRTRAPISSIWSRTDLPVAPGPVTFCNCSPIHVCENRLAASSSPCWATIFVYCDGVMYSLACHGVPPRPPRPANLTPSPPRISLPADDR